MAVFCTRSRGLRLILVFRRWSLPEASKGFRDLARAWIGWSGLKGRKPIDKESEPRELVCYEDMSLPGVYTRQPVRILENIGCFGGPTRQLTRKEAVSTRKPQSGLCEAHVFSDRRMTLDWRGRVCVCWPWFQMTGSPYWRTISGKRSQMQHWQRGFN